MVGIENAGLKYDTLEVYFAKNEIGKDAIEPHQSDTTIMTTLQRSTPRL